MGVASGHGSQEVGVAKWVESMGMVTMYRCG